MAKKKKKPKKTPRKKSSGLKITAGWASFLLSFVTSVFVNQTSANPNVLYFCALLLIAWIILVVPPRRYYWLWIVCFTVVVAASPFAVHWEKKQKAENASFSVMPYAQPLRDQPLSTDFILVSNGPSDMDKVSCEFRVNKLKAGPFEMANTGFGGSIFIERIRPGEQTTLHSSNYLMATLQGMVPEVLVIECKINYSEYGISCTRSFHFFTKQQDTGEFKWYPVVE